MAYKEKDTKKWSAQWFETTAEYSNASEPPFYHLRAI